MAEIRVTGYVSYTYFEDEPGQKILLVNHDTEIGNIMFSDPALCHATKSGVDFCYNQYDLV